MFHVQDLELGLRGQFHAPLVGVYGESVAFHNEVTSLLVWNVAG